MHICSKAEVKLEPVASISWSNGAKDEHRELGTGFSTNGIRLQLREPLNLATIQDSPTKPNLDLVVAPLAVPSRLNSTLLADGGSVCAGWRGRPGVKRYQSEDFRLYSRDID